MSMSPENYRVIREKYEIIVKKVDKYLMDAAKTPVIFESDIQALSNEIICEIGKCELGARNLKTTKLKSEYQEMLDNLEDYHQKLLNFWKGCAGN